MCLTGGDVCTTARHVASVGFLEAGMQSCYTPTT